MPQIDEILQSRLDAAQCAAAIDRAREVLALACAGSGKSTTLAYRIARLLAEGESPRGIVAFTFTEKAAEAIKLRAAQALAAARLEPTVLGAMYIGTIHSYCQNVLAEISARYRQFEVLDENRLKLYLMSRYTELGLRALREQRGTGYFDTVGNVSDAWKTMNDELVAVDDVAAADPLLGEVLRTLAGTMRRDHYIDFSLMIRRVVDALQSNAPAALQAVSSLRHLMVDEYQDVNPAQEALVQLLHRNAESLFVVGDDDQAIYGWRGADVSNIIQFHDRFPACSTHTLSRNYRSTPAIVGAADEFVRAELGAIRIPKTPSAPNNPTPRDFRNLWFSTRQEEADWVASRIAMLLGTEYVERDGTRRGLTPGDFAILMRSTRNSRYDPEPKHAQFTRALAARNIRYTIEAGGGVFDRPQVQAMRDTLELLRAGTPDRNQLRAHFDGSVLSAFPDADFDRAARVLTEWGRRIHTPPGGTRRRVLPQALVHDLLNAFNMATTGFDDGVLADLGVFSRIVQDVETVYLSIDSAGRFGELLNFLGNVAATGYDAGPTDVLRRPDNVTVSTVHRAKGLEFPVVFVVDMEARRFPRNRSSYVGWLPRPVIAAALMRGAYQGTPEEEARLFYTAVTRAERYLYITGSAGVPGSTSARKRSSYALRITGTEVLTEPQGAPGGLVPSAPVRRVDETVVPTSYSEIRYYLRCPHDYRLRKLFGFSPPVPDMFGFGQTVHTAVTTLHERFPGSSPTPTEASAVARDVFHLKHVPQSTEPETRPGAYEKARDRAAGIVEEYASNYGQEFVCSRQLEVRFEVPVHQAVISGSIDLMLRQDADGNVLGATVVDFKTIEGGDDPVANDDLHWTELALQVQLYAKAAREVLGENARTGAVHLLKDNQRIEVPVTDEAVNAAVANVEWAVERILAGDFPMRPESAKCAGCDFVKLCAQRAQTFATSDVPPPIRVPGTPGLEMARAFSQYDGA